MPAIHSAADRFLTKLGWLTSYHSFNFNHHYDPERTGFHGLRVINDDVIAPGRGFGMHPHRDMEIVTYVLEGAVHHQDSTGGDGFVRAGEIQVMHAGSGIMHSEVNDDPAVPLHLLQIWLKPADLGVEPGYGQRAFPVADRTGEWVRIGSPPAEGGDALPLLADARLDAARLGPGQVLDLALGDDRFGWLHLARGRVRVGDLDLEAGDAISWQGAEAARVQGLADAELLRFDLG